MKKILAFVFTVFSAVAAFAAEEATLGRQPTIAIYVYERSAPGKEFVRTALLELSKIREKSMVCETETENYSYKIFVGVIVNFRNESASYFHYSVVEIPKNNFSGGIKEFWGTHGLPLPGATARVLEEFASVKSAGRIFYNIKFMYLVNELDHDILGNFYSTYKQLNCKPQLH